MHAAQILHRDLKPGNLLIDARGTLKISDFGMAVMATDSHDGGAGVAMTEYVATRWYRAPEVMLAYEHYTQAMDLWSVGCIMGEMLGRRVLFAGTNYVHQLALIVALCGSPPESVTKRIASERVRRYVASLPSVRVPPLADRFPDAPAEAADLLDRFLRFDPCGRPTCELALQHAYLATVTADDADASHAPSRSDSDAGLLWDLCQSRDARLLPMETLRALIHREVDACAADAVPAPTACPAPCEARAPVVPMPARTTDDHAAADASRSQDVREAVRSALRKCIRRRAKQRDAVQLLHARLVRRVNRAQDASQSATKHMMTTTMTMQDPLGSNELPPLPTGFDVSMLDSAKLDVSLLERELERSDREGLSPDTGIAPP